MVNTNLQKQRDSIVSNGESIKKWSQLITEQYHPNIRAELRLKYVEIIKNNLEKNSKNLKWKVLNKTEYSITYEWSHQGSNHFPPTYEVAKLISHKNALFRIAYDKYTDSEDQETKKWKEIILNSQLKNK